MPDLVEIACRAFCFGEGCEDCTCPETCETWDIYENPIRAVLIAMDLIDE